MKRGLEQEDLAELLQVLDDKSEGASNDGNDDREPELEPKHKIFLSHSGVQKNFTEQLCKDLEGCDYYPFFDKRPDSLPKGKKFPELIFRAARQCQVAVLILSEEFFTHTKWPMLELHAFVQSESNNRQKVAFLPVYLGLSRTECTKNEIRRDGWLSVWKKWADEDKSIVVAEWTNALRVLGPSNGIEYLQTLGEVALREQIVSAIRGLVPPEKQWSDADVQGRPQICRAFIKKLTRAKPSPLYGVRVVGVHGMGGIGKTTFCKVLCEELNEKFEGKVFPAELGSKSKIELQKEALRELTDTNHDILTCATIETTTNLLRRRIRQRRVFLALDNVWQESIKEAKIYLRAGFHHGSIVMVTARSIDILGRMNIDESDCMEMPELEEEDAKCLFLHHIGFGHQLWTKDDEQKIEYCIKQCEFCKGENMGKHFHPLALKVLGSQLGSLGRDPSVWVKRLSIDDKFNQFREKEHPVFSILRRGFDLICAEDQLLFMDCILFKPSLYVDPRIVLRVNVYEWLCIVHQAEAGVIMDRVKILDRCHSNCLSNSNIGFNAEIEGHQMFCNNLVKSLGYSLNFGPRIIVGFMWLLWRSDLDMLILGILQLKGLKAKALIEGIGDGFDGVIVHDLYCEFAKLEAKNGDLVDARRWVWYHREASYPSDLVMIPSGNCWPNVGRVSVVYNDDCHHYFYDSDYDGCVRVGNVQWMGTIQGVKWQHFSNVVVLQLLIGENEVLDLQGLHCLRSLEVKWGCCGEGDDKLLGLGELRNLGWLQLRNIHYPPCCEEIGHLTSLYALRIYSSCSNYAGVYCSFPLERLNLDKCIQLRDLVIECTCLKELPDLSSLTSLRRVLFSQCYRAREVVGLSSQMSSLQELHLLGCKSLTQCAGLGDLVSLQVLDIKSCHKFMQLPDLHKLTNLRQLDIFDCRIEVAQGFNDSMQLQEVVVDKVQKLVDLDLLRHLRNLYIGNFTIHDMMPWFGSFVTLEKLTLRNLSRGVEDLPGIDKLMRLQRLEVDGAPYLLQLPRVSDLVALENLILINCCTEVGEAELPDLHNLTNLERLNLSGTPIRSLPGLEHLTQLRHLTCANTLLAALPDLSSFKNLYFLDLSECCQLTSLGSSAPMTALQELNVSYCYRLETLPNLRGCKSLNRLDLRHTRVRLLPEDTMCLATLPEFCDLYAWNQEHMNISNLLTEMSLAEVVMQLEAKQSQYFTAL